jgi:mono/diheme cytochrome c family protein
MNKSSHLLGMLALGLLSLSSVAGCSGEDPKDDNTPSGGSGGGGGAGTSGGATGGAKMTGVQLTGSAAYTILSGADATAGPTAAPAAYGTSVCSTCHGSVGQGAANIGPEIRHPPAAYATHVIRNGRPPSAMVAFSEASLPNADLMAIQTWLAGQPKPTTGQGLYLDFCGNCHGPMGGGGGVPVKAAMLPTATISAKIRSGVGTDPAQRGTYMPAFGADMLTDAEITLIAQFLGGT